MKYFLKLSAQFIRGTDFNKIFTNLLGTSYEIIPPTLSPRDLPLFWEA